MHETLFQSPENFKKYLDTCSSFFRYGYKNQIAIWRQNPDATILAGINAWKSMNGNLKPDATPVTVSYPIIRLVDRGVLLTGEDGMPLVDEKDPENFLFEKQPQYRVEFKEEVMYDVADVVNQEVIYSSEHTNPEPYDFFNKIRYITGYVIREAEPGELKSVDYYKVDHINNEFLIRKNLKDEEKDKIYLAMYLSYVLVKDKNLPNDVPLETYAKYVIWRHFGFSTYDISFIYLQALRKYDEEKQADFLMKLQKITCAVIHDMTRHYLLYDEIALLNSILSTDQYDKLCVLFDKIVATISESTIEQEIIDLRDKLMLCKEGYLSKLCEAVKNKQLFMYPPYELELDTKDYD